MIAIGTLGRSIAVGAALAAPASALPAQSTEDIAHIFIGTLERGGNNVARRSPEKKTGVTSGPR